MFKRILITIYVSFILLVLAFTSFASGRKMGLFVGINEYPTRPLPSSVNDATQMQMKLSKRYGFEASNTSLLIDQQATRQNILNKLAYYERETQSGDLFVFFYSGHGSVFLDEDSLEKDETQSFGLSGFFPAGYYDSTLVPIDANRNTTGKAWGNFILDDELNVIFQRYTAKGVQVVFISDSCHSGTLAKGLSSMVKPTTKFIPPSELNFDTKSWSTKANKRGERLNKNFNNLFLVIGSSQDNQFSSAENPETGTKMSLFTYALLKTLERYDNSNQEFTYNTIKNVVNSWVDRISENEQTPRLDDRFYDPSLLNRPIFSLVSGANTNPTSSCTTNSTSGIRIVIKVTDMAGNPIPESAFGLFTPNANLGKGEISKSDVLWVDKTNQKGLLDSCGKGFPSGNYQIKVVKNGYRAFIRNMRVEEIKKGIAVFEFKLAQE
jgi:metacaspase-1